MKPDPHAYGGADAHQIFGQAQPLAGRCNGIPRKHGTQRDCNDDP
jgi:hypothetical protein